jgi:hypothetical protein
MHLVAIDPAYAKPIAIAEWSPELRAYKADLTTFLKNPCQYITLNNSERIAVVEGQYMGKNKQTSLKLSRESGKIDQALANLGFKVILAPVFGPNSWINGMLRCGGSPDSEQVKKLSIALVKSIYQEFKYMPDFDSDIAAAVCIGQWWLDRNR